MPRMRKAAAFALAYISLLSAASAETQGPYGIGRTATAAEIAGWNIDVGRDGRGLPSGSGSVTHGREVFEQQCAACHGDKGQGGVGDRLVGGQGTLATPNPVRTVGSFWPYAPTLFDYIRRAMPWTSPRSLTDDQVYALTAYILAENKLIDAKQVINAQTLPKVQMPNRNGFIIRFPESTPHD